MHARTAATLTLAVALALALAGCSSESVTDGGTHDAGMDVDLDFPDAGCAFGACTSSVLTFERSVVDAPRALDHHATFLVTTTSGTWLYIAGGNDYTRTFAEVSRSEVHSDGALGTWQDGPALPTPRAGASVVVDGANVVLTGGKNFGDPITEVLHATVQSDGTLSPWETTTALPAGRFHHSSFAANGFLYVVGGLEVTSAVATVLRAPLHADGTVGTWTHEADLPGPRSHHASAVAAGFVFVTGGLEGAPTGVYTSFDDVLRAPLAADGTVGPWTPVGAFDGARSTHSSFVHDGHLYILGGLLFDTQTIRVDRAALSEDGTLDPTWETFVYLPEARSHVHQTPLAFDRFVYSVGGQLRDGTVTPHVYIGTFE